jgi:hypothetical protein
MKMTIAKKKITFAVIVFVIASVVVCYQFWLSCSCIDKYNAIPKQYRHHIANDLVNSNELIGLSREEIISKLGHYDQQRDSTNELLWLSAEIYEESVYSKIYLVLMFDSKGICIKSYLLRAGS